MSGVGGVRAFAEGTFAAGTLRQMADVLHHRGPDASDIWVGPDVGLAHTRLAVVDVAGSHQPMHSVDGRWVVALDGTIVNHQSLRAMLDYPFRTRGDTEVLVAGLALEGISFVERLHGQFAFAAHDLRTDTTHLVRDRVGVQPLYYRHVPGGIAFASEIKALLAVGPAPEVDHRSLDAYLSARAVPAPDTLFEGVKKVRPAHRVSIMPGGRLEEVPYWSLPECDADGTWSLGDAVEAVGDGLREAVRAALVADVPVGAHLSGDLETSLVVAEVQQLRDDQPIHTFAAGFAGEPDDALPVARHVSELLGTRHHEVRIGAADLEGLWTGLTWFRDAPLSDPTDLTAFAIARAAKEHVGVVLSGDGGAELFGGHGRNRRARLAERSHLMPSRLRSGLAGQVERHLGVPFTASQRERLLGMPAPLERRTPPSVGVDAVDRMLRHDLRHGLPDDALERGDRMSMAASVELRPALLDHRLVELAFRLPTSIKVRTGATPWMLKEVARALLPGEVIDRRTMFRAPPASWLRTALRDTVRSRLTGADSWVGQTLETSLVRDLVDRNERGADVEVQMWTLLCLEMWHDTFFGRALAVPRPRDAVHMPVARSS